jgi:CRP-like cAMP-binding protein
MINNKDNLYLLGNHLNNEFSSHYIDLIHDNIEKLSSLIKKQKINAYYRQKNSTSKEEDQNIIELNEINFNTIQYILSKKNRNQKELSIIQEFLNSLNLFNNPTNNVSKEKLLLSLSSFLKLEKRPQNSILFKFGNKGNKFYIVIKGELSVLILKEKKVELNSVDYFIHLLLLKSLKEDELLKKTLMANNKIGIRIDEINFEYNYDKLNKFFNKNFKVNFRKRKQSIRKTKTAHYSITGQNSKAVKDHMKRRNTIFTLNLMPTTIEENNSGNNNETEKKEKGIDDEEYHVNKYRKSQIFNNIILKKNDDVFYSELEIYNFELYELNKIVANFIKIKEQAMNKRYYNSINDYIENTYIFPYYIKQDNDPKYKYIKKDLYTIFQYFEIGKKKIGDIFGELALLHSDNKRTGTIMTITDCVLGFLSRDDYNNSLHDIEVRKRRNQVNFIMSFSIFDKMNWTFFETKFFNYFIRESFLKDSYLLRQGYKYDKIYFIMDGTFELTTSINYETIKNFVKYKSKKYPKYLDEYNIIKSKEPNDKKKAYKFKLSIIENRDIVGMDDYFILDDDISFINVKCLSDDAIVFSIEKNLLNNLRRKITEIDNNVKLIIKKRVEIMIQKLMIIYRVIINNPNVNTKKICLSEEFHKPRVKSALVNNNNSQTNHRKIKKIISLSQLNFLNKEENGKNENEEYIKDIFRSKERDNSLNYKENKNIEAPSSKKSAKAFNFIENINNEEFEKKKNKKVKKVKTDLFNPLEISLKKPLIYRNTNDKINLFNKKSNIKEKKIINKRIMSSFIKNKTNTDYFFQIKHMEKTSSNKTKQNMPYINSLYNSVNTNISSKNSSDLSIIKKHSSHAQVNIFDIKSLVNKNNRKNKENEKGINLSANKKSQVIIDRNNKAIFDALGKGKKSKGLNPESYLKVILGTRFKKHEENAGKEIISKKLLDNEDDQNYFATVRLKKHKSKNEGYSSQNKKHYKLNLSDKNKYIEKLRRIKSKESPIVDFLLYNTMISKNINK